MSDDTRYDALRSISDEAREVMIARRVGRRVACGFVPGGFQKSLDDAAWQRVQEIGKTAQVGFDLRGYVKRA